MPYHYSLTSSYKLGSSYEKYVTSLEADACAKTLSLKSKFASTYNKDISQITLHKIPLTAGLSPIAAFFYKTVYLISLVVVAPLSLISESFGVRRAQILNNYWVLFKITDSTESPPSSPISDSLAIVPLPEAAGTTPQNGQPTLSMRQRIENLLIYLFSFRFIREYAPYFMPKDVPIPGTAQKPLNLDVVNVRKLMSEEEALALFKLTREEMKSDPDLLKKTYESFVRKLQISIARLPAPFAQELVKMQQNYLIAYTTLSKVQ